MRNIYIKRALLGIMAAMAVFTQGCGNQEKPASTDTEPVKAEAEQEKTSDSEKAEDVKTASFSGESQGDINNAFDDEDELMALTLKTGTYTSENNELTVFVNDEYCLCFNITVFEEGADYSFSGIIDKTGPIHRCKVTEDLNGLDGYVDKEFTIEESGDGVKLDSKEENLGFFCDNYAYGAFANSDESSNEVNSTVNTANWEMVRTDKYKVLIPPGWNCEYEANAYGVTVYHSASKNKGYGGKICEIAIVNYSGELQKLGYISDDSASCCYPLVVQYPEDIQYGDDTKAGYEFIRDDLDSLFSTVEGIRGYVFVPLESPVKSIPYVDVYLDFLNDVPYYDYIDSNGIRDRKISSDAAAGHHFRTDIEGVEFYTNDDNLSYFAVSNGLIVASSFTLGYGGSSFLREVLPDYFLQVEPYRVEMPGAYVFYIWQVANGYYGVISTEWSHEPWYAHRAQRDYAFKDLSLISIGQ